MSDGIKKNAEKVVEGLRHWWWALKDTWDDIGAAVDDKDIGEVFHLLTRIINDTVKIPHRLWTYTIVVGLFAYLGTYTGLYNWPLSWTGL